MRRTWGVVTAATEEPVSLPEAKSHLRIDGSDDDARIEVLLLAARHHIEQVCARSLCTQTRFLDLDEFPADVLGLAFGPVVSITHVRYYDASGVLQTWSSSAYETDLTDAPARLRPRDGYTWPTPGDKLAACRVTYVAGYGGATAVPRPLRAAILLQLELLHDRPDGAAADALRRSIGDLIEDYRDRTA